MSFKPVSYEFTITGFQEGNKLDFDHVFELYYWGIKKFAFSIVRTEADAEDIAADSFFKLWKLHARFESLKNIKAFLIVAARNGSIDLLRYRHKKRSGQKQVFLSTDPKWDTQIETAMADTFTEIDVQIEQLPPRCQEIFKLLYYDRLSQVEVSKYLNIKLSNVQKQKEKAINLLYLALLKKRLLPDQIS